MSRKEFINNSQIHLTPTQMDLIKDIKELVVYLNIHLDARISTIRNTFRI